MEGILKFNLPEEQEEFENAVDAAKWKAFAIAFSEYLRQQTKYCADNYTDDQYNTLESIREQFYEILMEHKLEI